MENPVFAAASLAGVRNRINPDGTCNVFCSRCEAFICTVAQQNRFHSALCAICQASDRGIVLTKEQEDQIRLKRMPDGNMLPQIVVDPPQVPDPMYDGRKETEVGNVGYFFRTISKLQALAKAAVKKKTPESKKLANEKRKRPVLEGGLIVNLEINEDKK